MLSNHFILGWPLLHLPSVLPSIRVFPSELALCIRWPKYWSFSFNINPSNEYSGLISFWIDWLISLQSKGFSRVFQHRNLLVLSFLYGSTLTSTDVIYMTTGKTIALTIWTFVSKVMSLLFKQLSRFVTCSSAVKVSTCNAGDLGSIPVLGRSPGEGKSYPLQYSGLEDSMDCTESDATFTFTDLS